MTRVASGSSRRSPSNGWTWASAIVPGSCSRRGRFRTTSSRPVIWANWRGSSPTGHGTVAEATDSPDPSRPRRSRWPRSPSSSRSIIRPRPSEVFNLREGRTEPVYLSVHRRPATLPSSGPSRSACARRVAASLGGPGTRACAWAYVALGLAEKDKAGASEAMDRAIQEIDRLRESGPGPEPVMPWAAVLLLYPTNPAAVILPVVERVAPNGWPRSSGEPWRFILGSKRTARTSSRAPNIGFECMLLARYDRQVAAVLFEPIDSYLRSLAARKGPRDEFDPSVITAKGCIDPRSAVALLESVTPPRDYRRSDPAHQARRRLAEVLGMPIEKRWMRLWSSMLVRFDD